MSEFVGAILATSAVFAGEDPIALGYRTQIAPASVAQQIITELTRPNDDPVGRALPIAAHWNTGPATSAPPGWNPDFVLDYLDAGEYVIPTFELAMPSVEPEPWSYYAGALARAREHGIPIAIRFTQWDRPFTDDPFVFGLPAADNPNVVDVADGTTILSQSDPQGPLDRWREVGTAWAAQPTVAAMQAAYPNPPLVIWLNNFEQPRLQWGDAGTSWRFVQAYGPDPGEEATRRAIGDGWIERDGALWEALRTELGATWREVSIAVCYSAFGRRSYGLWSGWDTKSLHIPGRFSPWPTVVDGSGSYYVFGDAEVHSETDTKVDSPKLAAMNWPFMLDEAYRDRPDYFWEMSVSDGGLERHDWYRTEKGQVYDEFRYLGYVRFGMWVTRPRIVREFRLRKEDREPYLSYFDALLQAVREVHLQPDLRRFWRHGELVANTARPHPYQSALVPGYTDDDVQRNFLLDTSVDPPRPWVNETELPVFALALVLGEAPEREWLLYAHAPLVDVPDVTITLPELGEVVVDVPRGAGRFWSFAE